MGCCERSPWASWGKGLVEWGTLGQVMTVFQVGQSQGVGVTEVRAGLCVAQAGAPELSCLPGARELEGPLVQPPPNTGSFCPGQTLPPLLSCLSTSTHSSWIRPQGMSQHPK